MIRYLHGTVIDKVRNHVVIDVRGVGYGVMVTPQTITQVENGQDMSVHISESIREDGYDLYGFLSSLERDMFELLRKVSGVGPKVAMALTGFYSPADLQSIIHTNDVAKLSLVPGVGKKVSEKIIVELKDKTKNAEFSSAAPTDADTVAALQSLGYSPAEIAKSLPKVPANLATTSERITWILRHLAD